MSTKMTWKEHFAISRRAVRLLFSTGRTCVLSLILGALVKAILPYVPIFFSARLIDALAVAAPPKTSVLYAALTVGLTALLGLFAAWLDARYQVGYEALLRQHDWMHAEKAMELSYASIEDRELALQRERIKQETDTGYNLYYLLTSIRQSIFYIVQILASVSLTVSLFAMPAVPLWAKLLLLAGLAVTALINVLVNGRSAGLSNRFYAGCIAYNTVLGEYDSYLTHYTSGKDIRLYAMEKPLAAYIAQIYRSLADGEEKMQLRCSAMKLAIAAADAVLRLGVYCLLIYAALQGSLSVGLIARYVSCVMLLLTAASRLTGTMRLGFTNHHYLKRFFAYFDIPNPMYRGTLGVEKRDDNEYEIEFRDVSFRYPGSECYALRHVNVKLRIGEKLAVVGQNGSGKTTFIKLLCRLYDPTEGEILLNGVNIKKYDYAEYQSLFSVVFQDFRLFAFALGQNVAAAEEYDAEKARQCLFEAGFGPAFEKMPQGLSTALYHDFEQNGIEISGGEAQKIALARALYKNAPFIVLDEPTAALDPVSEYEVYRKFNAISGGKTAIYISHRLASCRFCDAILVFNAGAVVQHGTHGALLCEENGKYAALWNAQAQYYTE